MKRKFKTTKIKELCFQDMKNPKVHHKFSDFYSYKNSLGAGSFGFVVAAIDLETNEEIAVKIVEKQSNRNLEAIKNEIAVLQVIDEQAKEDIRLIHIKHVREFKNYYILALELAKGGNLENYLQKKKSEQKLTEDEVATIMKNLL